MIHAVPIALALCAILGSIAHAQPYPTVVEIAFEGNDTTQPKVMLREMALRPGAPADPAVIERSRQAIQDLGLFRWVKARQEPLAEGVRVVFAVDEKWYILPTPRLDANSDEQYGYGFSLRWANVWGLNHTLRGNWSRRDTQEEGRDVQTNYSVTYSMPFVLDRPLNLYLAAGHTDAPVSEPVAYDESFDSAQFLLSRSFARGAASQGWTLGGGLLWQRQDTGGENAPAPHGMATALVASTTYRDVRFKVYSEEGEVFSARWEFAAEDSLSDYDYSRFTAGYERLLALGSTPHQNLNLGASIGTLHGGPADFYAFALGGASTLRGYERQFRDGDTYYLLSAEYLRPVYWRWLRLVAIFEAGNVFLDAGDFDLDRVFASVGLGLRIRLSRFVNFEVEAGIAYPLVEGDGARPFAGGV